MIADAPEAPQQPPTAAAPAKTVINQHDSQLVRHHVPRPIGEAVARIVEATRDQYKVEPEIWVYGKQCRQPRNIQFRSDESKGYFYSGQVAESQPLTKDMIAVMAWANGVVGAQYNGILINQYTDGTKTVGAHADSEAGLDPTAGALAISHGAERKFRIREKRTKQMVKDVPARQGEAIQMKGQFQSHFTHDIPRESTVLGERVSLTFRLHDIEAERKLWASHMRKVEQKKRQDDDHKQRQQAMRESLEKTKAKRATEDAAREAERERIKRKREDTEEKREAIKKIAMAAEKDEKAEKAALEGADDGM